MATILFLTHRIPYPPNKGDKLRAYQLLKHWTQEHQIFLGCFVEDPDDWRHTEMLRSQCAGAYFARLNSTHALLRSARALINSEPLSVPYYRDRGLAAWVGKVLDTTRPDCAFIFSSAMAQYVLGAEYRPPRVLMDFVDVDLEKWAEYAATETFPMRQIHRREARQLLRHEQRVAGETDASIFVSEPEAALFRKLAPEVQEKMLVIPNGIDSMHFSPENAGQRPEVEGVPLVVFTGWMDYRPNVDAVIWFSDTVFPKLRNRFPDATFVIVGAQPSGAVRALGQRDGIVVTGAVADTRPYVGYADVVVAPMRIGRGIQNKVLEGMAMARPVIVTPQALEGIDATPDTHLLLARDSEGFVHCVERLMDPVFAKAVGTAARQTGGSGA